MPADTVFIDVNQSDAKESNTALHVVAEMGLVELCKLLCLQPGVNKNALNSQGLTPLALAVIQGRLSVIKHLLQEPGIDINKGDKGTPLMAACIRGNAQVVELLLSHSQCDINLKSSQGETAMGFLLASERPNQNLISLLSHRAAGISRSEA
jgi:ankyrin repeat protein